MIYIYCGLIILLIGILFLVLPPRKPNRLYGYLSYLAQINQDSFRYSQRVAGFTNLVTGLIQIGLGVLITRYHLDKMFLIWLLTAPIFLLAMFVVTEEKLKIFLIKRDELPSDYVNPDDRPKRPRTRGFHDR